MNINQKIAHVTLLVDDYDEAINFYINKLGFEMVVDAQLNLEKRWVVVKPKGEGATGLLLAKAVGEEQRGAIGNQTGGRVFLFLQTDNFDRDFVRFSNNGVVFIGTPREEVYGKVVVFEDLYGNKWDLIQYK